MHKFNGITLVVYKAGQPRSEALAALERAMIDDIFVSPVVNPTTGEEGYGATFNTLGEAEQALEDVHTAEVGLAAVFAGGQYDKNWQVY